MAKQLTKLDLIWQQQVAYNNKVRTAKPMSWMEWMKDYILGAISEVNEILNETSWKAHKKGHPVDRTNLARELADLTKYTFSLWEWAGFSSTDMLDFVYQKGEELDQMWFQDFQHSFEPGSKIVITDIDGTIADYRKGLLSWLRLNHSVDLPEDTGQNLMMDIDLGLTYPVYLRLKEEFESSGEYARLPLYSDVELGLKYLHPQHVKFLAYTARPAQAYSRIWFDTWTWLEDCGIAPYFQELRIGREQRVARACELTEAGHAVCLIEDEPDTALRAAASSIQVFLRSQPYNEGVSHRNIQRFEAFPFGSILACLEGRLI